MAALLRPQHLNLPLAPLAAGAVGLITAALFALVPTDLLESLVVDSGVAAVLSAAEPPLGLTARLALILLCGGGVGLVAWFGLFLLVGARTVVVRRGGKTAEAPVLRRADSHPDAPPRRPLFANTDLGTPFLQVRAKPRHLDAAAVAARPAIAMPRVAPPERPLPVDLDQPLAAFDPAALPPAPVVPPVAAPPAVPEAKPEAIATPLPLRRQTFAPGERLETFPLTPPAPAAPPPRRDPAESIHTLLDRLERVAGRRDPAAPPPPPPQETIDDALAALRRMAMRPH